jgi:hypothetical protein
VAFSHLSLAWERSELTECTNTGTVSGTLEPLRNEEHGVWDRIDPMVALSLGHCT